MKTEGDCYRRRGSIFIFITALTRVFGLITLAGLAYVTYLEWSRRESENFRIYVTIVTGVFTYLELLWIFDKCVSCCAICFRNETCFYWICCLPFDNWMKTIIYVEFSIPFLVSFQFLPATQTDVRPVGVLLIITGCLYFLKTFKYQKCNVDDLKENDYIFSTPHSFTRPSISTQTSGLAINKDELSSIPTVDEELNKKH